MPEPAFPANTLDADGDPKWITELACADPNHVLHVVRGLDPEAALEAVGAKPHLVQPCELPGSKPDDWTSLPGAALGVQPGTAAALLAGRVGDWTFVYDDSGHTFDEETEALSASGRTAATSVFTINADASMTFAVDGEQVAWINVDDLGVEDLAELPEDLRAAFEVAGVFQGEDVEPGGFDYAVTMRATCALAGLTALTIEDVRRMPLLGASFG
ncbi:DUF6461 domain-containing protein [Saccharopolyspora mangrovi]|uniref:DUF6461 domain-containing protein n=1 Tax=Saccharopolyspora mangrovi TaxID=3082379 RepID=A0ABU6A6U5_9PSEU|nr:DUF6461 domain-containing protein [Saccharopolyspora sp. S2-29]MEB3367284.1 DUF6461 domain-containing protein [Saccharopolyspora sp. S2-29]